MIKNYNYSIFAELGNLSQFNLYDLQKSVEKSITFYTSIEGDIIKATFTDNQTILVIWYNLEGEFIKIFSETWKSPASYFERKNMHI
jgi:queuine/archaeosine tRNA-ribosyltransferase